MSSLAELEIQPFDI